MTALATRTPPQPAAPTSRECSTAVVAHASYFFLPVLAPAAVWLLGRFIGSPVLTATGRVVTLAHLAPWALAGLSWVLYGFGSLTEVPLGSAISGLVGFAAVVLLVFVRPVEAVLGAIAAGRGEVRPYWVGLSRRH